MLPPRVAVIGVAGPALAMLPNTAQAGAWCFLKPYTLSRGWLVYCLAHICD